MFLERRDDERVRQSTCGWGVALQRRRGGVTMTTTCAGLCMQATQYSSRLNRLHEYCFEHGKEAKRWAARDAWAWGRGRGLRTDSCYYKGHLEWGGGRLLNGFVEASILISVYYVDQNSINVRHSIIPRTIIIIRMCFQLHCLRPLLAQIRIWRQGPVVYG